MKLKDAIKELDDSVSDTLAFFDQLDLNNISVLLEAFSQLRESRDLLVSLTKLINELYEKVSYETIPTVFKANNFDSVKLNGKNFILSARVNASIPENMRHSGYKWLTDVAKVPELIVPRVNPKQLSSFVKSYFETNAQWPPEDAVKIHLQEYIQVRKA